MHEDGNSTVYGDIRTRGPRTRRRIDYTDPATNFQTPTSPTIVATSLSSLDTIELRNKNWWRKLGEQAEGKETRMRTRVEGEGSLVAKEGCGRVEWPILQPWAVIRIEFSGQLDRKRDDESNFRTRCAAG